MPVLPAHCACSHQLSTARTALQVDTARRSFTDVGVYLEPSRVLGASIGITSAYTSHMHSDPTDMLFSTAFIGKCGKTLSSCGCDPRGCAAALFKGKRSVWEAGELFHGGLRCQPCEE